MKKVATLILLFTLFTATAKADEPRWCQSAFARAVATNIWGVDYVIQTCYPWPFDTVEDMYERRGGGDSGPAYRNDPEEYDRKGRDTEHNEGEE